MSVIFLVPILVYSLLWGGLALWFRAPGPEWAILLLSISFAAFGFGTLWALFNTMRWRWLAVFVIALIFINFWWNTLTPPSTGNWSPEVERQVTGTITGDVLTLENVRAFEWRTKTDVAEIWVTRQYDLSQIISVDLFMSYWAGPQMAHLIMSFGFEDGRYLAWSNEVRREDGTSFSPVADFFKAHSIAMVASEERDVVGLRSNIRNERVQIFRLRSEPGNRRKLLEAYVTAANELVEKPRWFHSVFTNCSRSAILLARHVGIDLPVDWRILVNGYFPEYLYARGAMNEEYTIEELYYLGDIREKANAAGLSENYSEAIRKGVPKP